MAGVKRCAGAGVVLASLLFCFGCGSVGYRASDGQAKEVRLPACEGKFSIRNVETSASGNIVGIYNQEVGAVLGALTSERLNRALAEKYPGTFSTASAQPLDLSVALSYKNNFGMRMMGAVFCGFSYGLIPFCMTSDYEITISAKPSEDTVGDVLSKASSSVSLQRKGWASIIPTGYIPCPYSTDTTKEVITGPSEVETLISEEAKLFISRYAAACIAEIVAQANPEDIKRAVVLRGLMSE